MKKLAVLLVLVLFAAVSSADELPSEDLDRLNKESIKQFHIKHEGKGLSLSRGLSKPYPGTPEEAAEKFLKEYHRMFKLSEDLSELKLEKKSGSFMGTDLKFRQYYKGVPVYLSGIGMSLDNENRIYAVSAGIQDFDNFNINPVIKPHELQETLEGTAPEYESIKDTPVLTIYFLEERPLLVYILKAYKGKPYAKNLNRLIVDASNGEVLKESSLISYRRDPFITEKTENNKSSSRYIILAQDRKFSGYIEPKPYTGPIPTGPGVVHFEYKEPQPKGPIVNKIQSNPGRPPTKSHMLTPEEIERLKPRIPPSDVKGYTPRTKPTEEEIRRAREEQWGPEEETRTAVPAPAVALPQDEDTQ